MAQAGSLQALHHSLQDALDDVLDIFVFFQEYSDNLGAALFPAHCQRSQEQSPTEPREDAGEGMCA